MKKNETSKGGVETIQVESTRIKEISYDPKTEVCRVQFHKGGSYLYNPFPQALWDKFKVAESPGKFFEQYVKPEKSLTTTKIPQ